MISHGKIEIEKVCGLVLELFYIKKLYKISEFRRKELFVQNEINSSKILINYNIRESNFNIAIEWT